MRTALYRIAAAAPLALSTCHLTAQDTIYAGSLQPRAGSCDPSSRATLTLRHGAVLFAPTSGVLVLTGRVRSDGVITAALTKPGMDKSPYTLTLDARFQGEEITGSYVTPRCRYAVALSLSS